MSVSKARSLLGKASDFYEDISEVCEPCCVEGKRINADRFCVDCHEYLCQKCSTHHKAMKAMRSHVLVTIDDAKKAKPLSTKDKCSYKCTVHKDKSLKYFCKSHSYLGCSVCITIDHKQCKSIDYIPKVAEDIRNLDDFKEFSKQLNSLETSCKARLSDVGNSLKQMGTDEQQLKDAIVEFRKKMNNAFDKFENELTASARKINTEETTRLNDQSQKITTYLGNVDTLIHEIDTIVSSGKQCDTYVLMKKEANHLVALNEELVNTTKGKTYQRYEFQHNNEIFKVGAFGKMSCRSEFVTPRAEEKVSKPITDNSQKMTATVAKPCIDDPARSRQIQPGTRVRNVQGLSFYGCGTAGRYNSSNNEWLVKWDNGLSCWCYTRLLKILKK